MNAVDDRSVQFSAKNSAKFSAIESHIPISNYSFKAMTNARTNLSEISKSKKQVEFSGNFKNKKKGVFGNTLTIDGGGGH